MREFAEKTGIKMYKEGDGIEHVVLPEDGEIVPGDIVAGTDSHTDTHGALACFAFGVGTSDAEYAMATGKMYNFTVPETIKFNLDGKIPFGVYGKDIILYILGKMGAGGCSNKVAEFSGLAANELSMANRFTMCNMAVEMSARTAIFGFDDKTEKYLKGRSKWPYYSDLCSDSDAKYSQVIDIDVSKIGPMVSFPHLPANAAPISKLEEMIEKSKLSKGKSFVAVDSDEINNAFIGSCTNGREEDMYIGASILAGKKVHPNVNLIVVPGSRKIYNWMIDNGIMDIYAQAGANIESSNCGPCFGKHMGVLSEKGRMCGTSNRNYEGRMGSKDAKIFLASPATVAASSIEGKITDPRPYIPRKTERLKF
jgi:3-isopropylmalate/(R)-2-methylmalate dehydratase large subunit